MDDFKVGMKSPSGCRIRMGGRAGLSISTKSYFRPPSSEKTELFFFPSLSGRK